MAEVGSLSQFFTGTSLVELKELPVRERRHWVKWATAVQAERRREVERSRSSVQNVQYLGR